MARRVPRPYSVDVEYTRDADTHKRDSSGTLRIPDIIVHRRHSNDNNLLAVEVKVDCAAGGHANAEDLEKLRTMKDEIGYKHAVALSLRQHNRLMPRWQWLDAERQRRNANVKVFSDETLAGHEASWAAVRTLAGEHGCPLAPGGGCWCGS